MSAPLLEVRGLKVGFEGRPAVIDGLGLVVGAGEAVGLVGASGAGKSLFARALLELLPEGARLHGGSLLWRGQGVRAQALRGTRIGYVFQDAAASLHPLRRVGAQLDECLRVHAPRLTRAERSRRIDAALADVGFDADPRWLASFPQQLSGGQRQRLMLALTLLPEPELLLADEPTSALDPVLAQRVCELLAQAAQRRGMGLLLISHDRLRVLATCTRVLELRDGRAWPAAHSHSPQIAPDAAAAPAEGAPLLEARALTLRWTSARWPWRRAAPAQVEALSLQLARGGRLGVVGGSGSGKSTLARGLLGLLAPVSGEVRWFGESLAKLPPRELRRLRPRVQMVFQDPFRSLDPLQRVDAMLAEAAQRAPAAERLTALELLRAVDLDAGASRRWPAQFSGGQRQRLAIARALATAPQVLVCDEATSALDHDTRDQVLAVLDRLARQRGLALLFIAHDLAAVARLCTHLLVLERGRVVEQGATAELLAQPRSAALREMLAAVPQPRAA